MTDADFNVKAIISAQTSQFEKGMKNAQSSVNSLSSSISNITNLVKKVFAFTGIAVGTKAIVDFGKSCVQEANEAIKTFKILDNTVKATGADAWTSIDELENASKTLSDSTNYSVTEIQQMQSVLLGFTNITGEAFDGASEAVLDMATVMGMDLTSAVQTIGKALDDPITGLDSLRRQGFKFTDEQKAELGQLVKNGKQYEAQKIILDTLAISYGGAAKAGQDSFAKQRHAVEDLYEGIGVKLIPVMQVFAENNTKMINSLRELIENMDFTPVVNVVTNLNKIFAETFNTISGYLRNVGDYVSDFISRFNFKPIISVLDGLLGGLSEIISKFKEMNSQRLEIFDKLKESLIDFSNSETFQNIINFVNKIIDGIFFLWSEIQDVVTEIKNLVVNKIIEIWGKIKELFQNGQNALSQSGQDIASWGDLFWEVLDNIFKIFQDLINGIKAIIHGDWTVAWEYAKLTVMRIADNILDIFSTIANAFPDLVNKFLSGWNFIIEQLNKARKFFGLDPLGLAEAFESVDLSKKTGLEDKIKEAEDKIKELTGHVADQSIKDLEGVSTKFAGFTSSALGFIEGLTDGVVNETEKQKKYFNSTTSEVGDTYKKFSEWDGKLLQQRLEHLDEWSKEAHEINLQLIEEERKKALEADTTGAETEKINKYYNNKIEEEDERFEKAKRERTKETLKIVTESLKKFASTTINVFKKVVSTIKDTFSKIGSFIKNVFDKTKNIFTTLFDFNVDDSLNSLLKIEDAILTFFVETLPRLPSFFESAFSSVLRTIKSLIDYIDWDKVKGFLTSMVQTFVKYGPEIVSGIVTIFSNLVTTISTVLVENAPQIVNALGEIFFTIIEALPTLVENLINVIGTFISEIGRYITENGDRLAQDLSNLVHSIVEEIANFIKNGGWKNLLNALLTIQKAIEKAVMDNIDELVDTIIAGLPDLINMLMESIVSASKTLAKLIKPILKLIIALIKALIEVAFSDEVLDASIEVIQSLIEALLDVFINEFPRSLPKIITKIIGFITKSLPKMTNAIVKTIVKLLVNTNWGEVLHEAIVGFAEAFGEVGEMLKDIFEDAFNTIGELLNTLWQGTFANPWLWQVLNGMADNVKQAFAGIGEFFNGIWNNLTSGAEWAGKELKNGFEWAINGIKGFFEGLATKVSEVFGKIGDGIKWAINGVIGVVNNVIAGINGAIWWTGNKIPEIGYLAKGTNNAQKGMYLVGEAGPELVQFNGGERVLNNRNTNKVLSEMGSNSGNTFNVTFNNLQDTTAFAMMNQLKQYNRQMAINGVI